MVGTHRDEIVIIPRIDPLEKLQSVYKELSSLHRTYSETPFFGVDYNKSEEFEDVEEKEARKSR